MKLSNKNGAGFTLISVIIAVSIFVLLSVVSIANFRAGQRSEELKIAVKELVSVLKDLQVKSFTGELSNKCGNDPPIGGYGFKAHKCSSPICEYYIFADCDGNNTWVFGENLIDPKPKFSANIAIKFYRCPTASCDDEVNEIPDWWNITFDLYQESADLERGGGVESTDEDCTIDPLCTVYPYDKFKIRLTHSQTNKFRDIFIYPETGAIT